jgi:uncharacterized protein
MLDFCATKIGVNANETNMGKELSAANCALLPSATQNKHDKLKEIFGGLKKVLVAFSGGVDSALVAKVACDVLGPARTLAVLAVSQSLAEEERRDALALASEIGLRCVTIETQEVDDPEYAANPINRCYFCKTHVYAALSRVAIERGFEVIVDGFNADDSGEFRPGRKAGRELGVRSPLFEVGMRKEEIRELARHLGLSNWDKPPMACLSSRVEYGINITPKVLSQVDRAEAAVRRLGFNDLRVRHHDKLARVEVDPRLIDRAMAQRDEIIEAVKAAGYTYVTIDLEGLRHGSMNEGLPNRG